MVEEFYLDWDEDELMVWEKSSRSLVVKAIIEGIKLNHVFPPVSIVKAGSNLYCLLPGGIDLQGYSNGGHHRAMGHREMGSPLRCYFGGREVFDVPAGYISMDEVSLNDHVGADKWKLRDSLAKLPSDIAKEFCREHNLDIKEYLSQ